MRDVFSFVGKRALSLVKLMVIGCPVIIVGVEARQFYNDFTDPPENWFRVYSISVPNHCAGENPIVHVTRTVKKEFLGAYTTQYVDIDHRNFPVCDFSSLPRPYKPKPKPNILVVTDLWSYMGRRCVLDSGTWQPEVTWSMQRKGYHDAYITKVGHPFEIYPRSDARCQKR